MVTAPAGASKAMAFAPVAGVVVLNKTEPDSLSARISKLPP
jgi:hypothetical protein